jgi:hypothetical protein
MAGNERRRAHLITNLEQSPNHAEKLIVLLRVVLLRHATRDIVKLGCSFANLIEDGIKKTKDLIEMISSL